MSELKEKKYGYGDEVLSRYQSDTYVGSLDKNNPLVGTGVVGAPACGDVMKLQIQLDPENKKISQVRFKTFGCAAAISASAYAAEKLEGLTLEESKKITNKQISQHLSLPPVKNHCSMLAEEAIAAALKDLKNKGAIAEESNDEGYESSKEFETEEN